MSAALDAYRQRLLFALRKRRVPGPRIAEAIAEVESHVADTGEDPATAFGDPDLYAGQLSQAGELSEAGQLSEAGRLSHAGRASEAVRPSRGSALSVNAITAAAAFAATALIVSGLYDPAGDGAFLGLPTGIAVAAGLVMLAALAVWLLRLRRHQVHRIVDPRTGHDLRVPAPRWALAVLAFALALALIIGLIVR